MKILYLTVLMVTLSVADFTMVYKMEDNILETIEYKDERNAKLSYVVIGDENSTKDAGQYLIDGRRYSVSREDNNLTYIDLDKENLESIKIEKDFNITDDNCTIETKKSFFTVLKKGGPKSIAGMKGYVWDVVSQEDGEEYNESIVVSDNKELVDAMKNSFSLLKLFGEGPYGMEVGDDTESMMIVADNFVLLSAEGLEFVSLHHQKIPKSLFVLPKDAIEEIEDVPDLDDEEKKLGKEMLTNALKSDEICLTQNGE